MTATGYVVKTLSVKLKTTAGTLTEYNMAVLGVKETPTRTTQTAVVASGETVQDVGPTTWAVEIGFHADYSAGTFHRFLLDNDGATGTIEWQPNPTKNPTLKRSANVILVAPDADSQVNAFATGTVTLPVVGAITTSGS